MPRLTGSQFRPLSRLRRRPARAVPQYTVAGLLRSTATHPGDSPAKCSSTVQVEARRAINTAAYRPAASVGGDPHHCIRSAGRCSCGRWRRYQTRSRGRIAASRSSVAGTDQAGHGHILRDADEHHCLSSFSHAQRQHRRVPQKPPHRHDYGHCFVLWWLP